MRTVIPWALGLVVLAEASAVAWSDARHGTVPNAWPLLNLALFPAALLLFPHAYGPLGWGTAAAPLLWLAAGFVLFRLRIMGAGDSKYLASLFLLVPEGLRAALFLRLVLASALGCGALLAARLARRAGPILALDPARAPALLREAVAGRAPFAPVVLAAVAWFLLADAGWGPP